MSTAPLQVTEKSDRRLHTYLSDQTKGGNIQCNLLTKEYPRGWAWAGVGQDGGCRQWEGWLWSTAVRRVTVAPAASPRHSFARAFHRRRGGGGSPCRHKKCVGGVKKVTRWPPPQAVAEESGNTMGGKLGKRAASWPAAWAPPPPPEGWVPPPSGEALVVGHTVVVEADPDALVLEQGGPQEGGRRQPPNRQLSSDELGAWSFDNNRTCPLKLCPVISRGISPRKVTDEQSRVGNDGTWTLRDFVRIDTKWRD